MVTQAKKKSLSIVQGPLCPDCGGETSLIWREVHARDRMQEERTYECKQCGACHIVHADDE
jgi:predicted RNA-binding Zn-ribbon protein involved in translation (DUF1610 family)